MGLDLKYEINKRGFYPFGGGKIVIYVPEFKGIKPIILKERGKIISIKIYSICTVEEHIHFHKNLVSKVKTAYPDLFKSEEIDFVDKTYQKGKKAKHKATYIIIECDNGSIQKIESFWDIKTAYNNGIEEEKLLKELDEICKNPYVAIDEHHADQLLIFMALASGESIITIKEQSLHFQTMCHLLPIFLRDVKIDCQKIQYGTTEKDCYFIVKVKGIGYKPEIY